VSQVFHQRGHNAYVMPAHVAPADLPAWLAGVSRAQNVDGIIVTIPHKFAAFGLCATTSERAAFLGAVNTMRRNADGNWHGDMFDGLGFVAAMPANGGEPRGRRALLLGAGGAGSAIAHALVVAGVSHLAVCDGDAARRSALIRRLEGLKLCPVTAGSDDATGFDIVVNATPVGMQADDPLPVRMDTVSPQAFVGCVITAPETTPLIAAARAKGCATQTGTHMFVKVRDLMVDFLLKA
jgi:shikimate dehydrogenase